MRRHVLLVLFVFLMSLFTQIYLCATQDSDDSSDDATTTLATRQRRGRCPPIRDSLRNGWVRMRNRGRIAKFACIKGFQLIGNRVNTCIQGKWTHAIPQCQRRFSVRNDTYFSSISPSVWTASTTASISSMRPSESSPLAPTPTTDTSANTWRATPPTPPTPPTLTPSSVWTQASEMSAMTTKSASSVININEMSSDGTSPSADDNKTPITESTLDNNAPTNATNIIQEVSTLTTTTTSRSNALKSKFSSTEPTLETELTTLLSQSTINESNMLSSKSAKLSTIDSIQNVTSVPTSTPSLTSPATWPTTFSTTGTSSGTSSGTTSSSKSTTWPQSTQVAGNVSITSTLSSVTKASTPSSTSSEPAQWARSTVMPKLVVSSTSKYEISGRTNGLTTGLKAIGTTGSTKSVAQSSVGSTTESTNTSPMDAKSDRMHEKRRYTYGIRVNKQTTVTTPRSVTTVTTRRHIYVETNRPFERTTIAIKNSLFDETTTITPLRRRRQKWNTTTESVFTSSASESAQSQTNKVLTISLIVISMTILTTTFSLYLIRKLRTDRQNRLSDDSEMRYLTPNQVL